MDKQDPIPTLLFYLDCPGTEKLAYYTDWREAFLECRLLNVTSYNIFPWQGYRCDIFHRYQWGRILKKITINKRLSRYFTKNKESLLTKIKDIKKYSLIVILHSTNADSLIYLEPLKKLFLERRGKLIIFIGNEYNLLPEKLKFIDDVQADFVVTQLPREPAEWLYARQGKERIISAPHALNNKVFRCIVDPDSRGIDIGFIGDRYHLSVGDTERERLIEYFINEVDSGLKKDIRIPRLAGSGRRLVRQKYVNFLNSVKGTIAAESGTYYLDKTGQLQREIENYLKKYPGVSFKEISEQVIKNFHKPTVNGKAISSRHFEAVGTKTCQILLEGKYNDIFKPDMHYISLKKDFSNIKDVLQRFKDVTYRRQMVDSAYDYAMDSHTYGSRISYILDKVGL